MPEPKTFFSLQQSHKSLCDNHTLVLEFVVLEK